MSDVDVSAFVVDEEGEGSRLDAFVARRAGLSVREAARLCAEGRVLVDGRRAEKGRTLDVGARVEVQRAATGWLVPQRAPSLAVVYEDDDVVVIDKPASIATHPLARGEGGTAADAVAARFPEVASASAHPREGGACHRLDTGTSGLIAFARSREAWEELRRAFLEGRVGRSYLAVVEGRLAGDFVIDTPIAHHPGDKRRMVVVTEEGERIRGSPRPARSVVRLVTASERASLVVVEAHGGRRHQVRVHLASAGHPLVGDVLYGGSALESGRHLLHAALLALPGRAALVAAPPPDFLRAAEERGVPAPAVDQAVRRLG